MTKNTEIFVLNQDEVMAITGARHGDPHHILGMHVCLADVYVNAFLPDAAEVYVVDEKIRQNIRCTWNTPMDFYCKD